AAVEVLRDQLAALQTQEAASAGVQTGFTPEQALARLQEHIPEALIEKARASRRVPGERKRVTVLFADLSGFTSLSERLDPEVIQAFLNDLFQELASVVYQYEGLIEQFIGDAVMAVFGAPVTHEDDPERALRASLAMRERMEALNRRWIDRLGEPLPLHIGINTGIVIAGEIGSSFGRSYTVTGDTVNTASRLQSVASPGQILVGLGTQRLTHAAFTFLPLDPIPVKGKREPLIAFELERAKSQPGKSRGLQGLTSGLMGREAELAQLGAVADELAAGRGSIVTLTGDAGIGKSRLLDEWSARLRGRVRWMEGRCNAHTGALAYGPFLDLFRQFAGILDDDSETRARTRFRTAMERLFPGNSQAYPIFAAVMGMHLSAGEASLLGAIPAEDLRRRIFALVEDMLGRLTREQPIVLVMEDMHWADRTSVDLVEHLLPLTEKVPLAIVGVFRRDPDGLPQQLEMIADAGYAGRHTHISLQPLEEAASLAMVQQLLDTRELPASLRTLIASRAEGNPFFVEELIRALIGRGALMRLESGSGWGATPLIETVAVPDTLHGLLVSRLDRLPDETKWVVQQAAVIGRIFIYRVLRQMAQDPPGLEADLSHLERDDLIRERTRDPEVEYMFKHALTQEVAYESLLGERRKDLHCSVGEALEAVFADRLDEFLSIVAEHFLRGEAWEKAFDYFERAGDAATRLYAHAEARVHYGKALEALSHLPDTEAHRRHRVDTSVRLVSVSFGAESPERNLALLIQAEAVAKELSGDEGTAGDCLRLARIHNWMGRSHMYANQMHEAIGYYQQVLAEAQGLGDEELLAIPSSVIGRVMMAQGQFGRAGELLTRAIEPLERIANWQEWIISVGYRGISLAARGEYLAGLREGERALRRPQETNNLTAISVTRILLTVIEFFGGNLTRLVDASRATVEAGKRSLDPMYVYAGYGFLSWAESRLGNHNTAGEIMAKSKEIGQNLGGRLILADWFAAAEAEIALNAARFDEAVALAEVAVDIATPAGGIFAEGMAQRVWAAGLAEVKPPRWDEVDAHMAESLRALHAGEALLEAARTHAAWARICRRRGDDAAALEHFQHAAEQFETSALAEELTQTRRAMAELSATER
ncbi:MAG TPA: adenylate/guanylate cyclase domain-containing protein, partial [Chloroflexota bacterium]|nr:adenylate/guanylate cyclase domain-containing protein [Chloroflexota bacterium]